MSTKQKIPILEILLQLLDEILKLQEKIYKRIEEYNKQVKNAKMKSWKTVLKSWNNNFIFKYPNHIKKPFIWRCNRLGKNKNIIYDDEFIETDYLSFIQDYTPFQKHINKAENKYVTSFPNLNGDTILVVPIPRKNKDFAHLKNFIDNASAKQQHELWKEVVRVSNILLKQYDNIWISTHGTGVRYLHIRISKISKYYDNIHRSKFLK